MNGVIQRSAMISNCENFRWSLTRRWDDRPMLTVVMFNPSTADGLEDDPTIRTLCKRASRTWGFGGIMVVNVIPLRSPDPRDAIAFMGRWRHWDMDSWAVLRNEQIVTDTVRQAGAVLIAWGALASLSLEAEGYLTHLREEIEGAAEEAGIPIYCMGRTDGGMPKHPLARGKHRVPDDAPLVPWRRP